MILVKVGRPIMATNEQELRKKMKNRVSAIEARMRKKRQLEHLEQKVETLTKENERLRLEYGRLSSNGKILLYRKQFVDLYFILGGGWA